MLCISMKPGDYFTVDNNTVVQFDRLTGERVHLTVHAPREIPILRGELLERKGGQRPDCVMEKSPRYIKPLSWNQAKKNALQEMRQMLEQMGDSPEVQVLQEKLNYIFPQVQQSSPANT